MIVHSMEELIGNTPLLVPERLIATKNLHAALLVKLESRNPAGSAKDRIALSMLNDAENKGILKPGATVIEPTSGNTGIGLAALCAVRGYSIILTMPESMSAERRKLLAAYGAKIVLTPASEGMAGSIRVANELAAEIPGSFIPAQFDNPANPKAHFESTGPEIYRDTEGKIDFFVAGIGTGGTLSGTGAYLKSQNPAIRVVGVEPASSPLITTGKAGSHGLQGIGANFVPKNYDPKVCDEIITVTENEAYRAARELAREEGILAGITSGAALHAAILLACRPENEGKTIVALLPDTGDRYLSTPLFEE